MWPRQWPSSGHTSARDTIPSLVKNTCKKISFSKLELHTAVLAGATRVAPKWPSSKYPYPYFLSSENYYRRTVPTFTADHNDKCIRELPLVFRGIPNLSIKISTFQTILKAHSIYRVVTIKFTYNV